MKKIVLLILSFVLLFSSSCLSADFLNLSEIELINYYWPVNLLIDVHIEIWKWDESGDKFWWYITLIKDMSQYADLDIVDYLRKSIDVEHSLQYILNSLFQLLSKCDLVVSDLDRNMKNLEQTKIDCDASKELSDKNYSLALQDLNAKKMETYLLSSIESESCSSEARINYNAYKKIKDRILYYRDILKMKYDYFLDHKYDVIRNMSRTVN